jgi:hypothetical protein
MAILNATVGAGNMRMDELVTALGTGVLPTAKLAGLSIQDVMGALAILKDEGYGAYGAMAQFATALHFFYSPTDKATKAMKRLGMTQMQIADDMRNHGMVAALSDLKLHLEEFAPGDPGKQLQILGQILPGGRGRVILTLLNQLDRYQMKVGQINNTTGNFSKAVARTQATAAYQIHTAWSQVQVDLVALGDKVMNPGVSTIKTLTFFIRMLIKVTGVLISVIQKLLPFILAVAAATLLYRGALVALWAVMNVRIIYEAIAGFIALASAEGLATAAAVAWVVIMTGLSAIPIVLAISAIILAIYELITHFKQVKEIAIAVWDWIKKHWPLLLDPLVLPFMLLKGHVKGIVSWIKGALNSVVTYAKKLPGRIWHSVKSIPGGILHTAENLVPHFAGGVTNFAGGLALVGEKGPELAYLPGGSSVVPHGALMRSMGQSMNVPHSTQPGNPVMLIKFHTKALLISIWTARSLWKLYPSIWPIRKLANNGKTSCTGYWFC